MEESKKKRGRESQLQIRKVRTEEEEDNSPKERGGRDSIQPYECRANIQGRDEVGRYSQGGVDLSHQGI
ncbi:hypothetical protein LIER_35723 [Lithospermum erythrorhizon]|uniref:Uncharacterized protein n=1 Tax=Lithospermum erythrorhizon TaxID=34254 RepID=A0AAV3NVF1_LITER